MAAPLFSRCLPLLLHRATTTRHVFAVCLPPRRPCSTAADEKPSPPPPAAVEKVTTLKPKDPPMSILSRWAEEPDFRKWKDKEAEILQDVDGVTVLVKDILHSNRYMDGERLTAEDEKVVIEKLLAYHPHSEDKIGCGLDFIMVDRHPQFKRSRCLFVVRTDGGWIDFSYQKCLRAYIREKYPSHAERFINEHYKRT